MGSGGGWELTFHLDCLVIIPSNQIKIKSSFFHRQILIGIPSPIQPHLLRPTHWSSRKPPIYSKIETAQAYPPSQARHPTLPPLHTLRRHLHLESRRTGLRSWSGELSFSHFLLPLVRKRLLERIMLMGHQEIWGPTWIRTKKLNRTSIDGGPS
jgi:hypothetical protein